MKRIAAALLVLVLASPGPARAEFGVGLVVGGYSGDRLFSASHGATKIWVAPGSTDTDAGTELLVDMEGYAQVGLTGFGHVGERLGLRFELAFTDVDVDGKVRDSTGASQTLAWDQVFVLDAIAQATWRLGRSTDNYPYLALGPGLTMYSSESGSLDQLMPAIAVGAGWRMSAASDAWLEIGVRGLLQWPDWGDEEDRLAADEFDPESMVLSLSAAISVGRVF